jgi:hypothetical protein
VGDEQPTVTLDIDVLYVVEEAAAAADHEEQATTGVVVMLVGFEVLIEVVDASRKDRNLHFGGTGIGFVSPVGGDRRSLINANAVTHG